MIATEQQVRLLRFGDFEVDLRSGELRKGGVKLKFGGPSFLVLSDSLLRAAGPRSDTGGNADTALAGHICRRRSQPECCREQDSGVLGDSAESPRFVETLPRRGYRFIGELHAPVGPTLPAVPLEPVRVPALASRVEDRGKCRCYLGSGRWR